MHKHACTLWSLIVHLQLMQYALMYNVSTLKKKKISGNVGMTDW